MCKFGSNLFLVFGLVFSLVCHVQVMVACSVVCTVFILNFHERTVETHELPRWVETIFLQWLPWILRSVSADPCRRSLDL